MIPVRHGAARNAGYTIGHHADINMFDLDRLASPRRHTSATSPNGAGHLKIPARGYAATLMNGVLMIEHDENTGSRPDRAIREFQRR